MSCRAASLLLMGFFLCFTSQWICSAEASPCCYAKNYADHTTYYLTESIPESLDYSWKVNDVVVAYEGNVLDKSLVLEQGPRNITLKACREDVKYWIGLTGEVINCNHNCPEKQTTEDVSSSAAAAAVAVAVAGAVLLILIIFFAYFYQKKLKQRVQAQEEGFCKNYYPASPTDTEAVIKEERNVVYIYV